MKKSLVALGVLGAFCAFAYAESSVTLYGLIEEGVLVQKNSKAAASVQLKSGFDQGSRWGIRGIEDLGGGNAVGFILEQGFAIDDGTVANGSYGTGNSGFTRESILYAQGDDWGSFAMGRTGALSFAQSRAILTGWVFGTGFGAGAWTTYGNNFARINNTVSYQTPDFGGFKLSLMYGNGIGTDTEQWSHNTHYYGIGAIYEANNIKSSLIYENVDWKGFRPGFNTDGQTGFPKRDQNVINFGFEYDCGSWTPMFAYQWDHTKDGQQSNMFGLSAKVDAGGGDFMIGVRYIWGKNTNYSYSGANGYDSNKFRAWNVDLGYIYPLSKRTALKAFAAYTGSSKLWKTYEFTSSQDTIYNGFQLYAGIRHSF
ncbi:MAG: porin [Burkholderiales bacterium]|nr:porin [Burkholderiales bacterium]